MENKNLVYEIFYVNVSTITASDVQSFIDNFAGVYKSEEQNIKRMFVPTYGEAHIEIIK